MCWKLFQFIKWVGSGSTTIFHPGKQAKGAAAEGRTAAGRDRPAPLQRAPRNCFRHSSAPAPALRPLQNPSEINPGNKILRKQNGMGGEK